HCLSTLQEDSSICLTSNSPRFKNELFSVNCDRCAKSFHEALSTPKIMTLYSLLQQTPLSSPTPSLERGSKSRKGGESTAPKLFFFHHKMSEMECDCSLVFRRGLLGINSRPLNRAIQSEGQNILCCIEIP